MEFNATFLATIISFIIFVFLMNKILYEPILNIMEKRKNYIDENYKTASDNDEKASALDNEIKDKKDTAKNEARIKYNEVLESFKDKKSQVITQAQQIARDELEKSNIELTNVSNDAKETLKNSMLDLANDIVEKIIGYKCDIQNFDNNKVNEILYK